MTLRTILASAAAVAIAATAAQASPADRAAKGEEKLAKMIEGRVAGKPVRCLPLHQIRSSRIIDRTAIVYEVGNTLYVNRPRQGAVSLDRDDILVTRTSLNQLCNVDIVRLVDPTSHIESGFVSLGEFVPYKKPPKAG
jgi:hypothetical protein